MTGLVNVGDVLAGKYRVEQVLGIGGMGIVLAATHLELDQRVAIKLMLQDAAANPQASERFLREARAVVKLKSEHVCRVLDVGRMPSGAPFIVMELLEGQDLAHVLAATELPVALVIDYALQTMAGLADAHVQGIVHRDLKPANLFATTNSHGGTLIKVLDFGISKQAVGGATKTGDMMGSPAYMAPEQMVSAKDVDARADIWALGVILYEALAHRLPFEADTMIALAMKVMNEPPPPIAAARRDLPAPLCAAVMRCLARQPDRRFATVGELARAIAPFGSAGAAELASTIEKVLRRSTPVLANTSTPLAQAPPATTLRSGAIGLPASQAPRRRRGMWALAVIAALAIAGGVTAFVVTSGKHDTAIATPTSPPPPAPPPPATIATRAPAPVASPPDAAAATILPADPVIGAALGGAPVVDVVAPKPEDKPEPKHTELRPAKSRPAKVSKLKSAPEPATQPEAPPSPPPPPASTLPEALDRTTIAKVMNPAMARITACGGLLEVHGNVLAHVTVSPDGTVSAVTFDRGSNPKLADCVKARIQVLTFAKTQRGGTFAQPFSFL